MKFYKIGSFYKFWVSSSVFLFQVPNNVVSYVITGGTGNPLEYFFINPGTGIIGLLKSVKSITTNSFLVQLYCINRKLTMFSHVHQQCRTLTMFSHVDFFLTNIFMYGRDAWYKQTLSFVVFSLISNHACVAWKIPAEIHASIPSKSYNSIPNLVTQEKVIIKNSKLKNIYHSTSLEFSSNF